MSADLYQLRVLHCWEDRESVPVAQCEHVCATGAGRWCRECPSCCACSLSCWMGITFGPRGTCMLPRGHVGEHDFTDDDKLVVSFAREVQP